MDLSGVPLSERDLFEKNEEMIRRLLDRQLELMELKEDLPKTDKIGRGKLQKEYGKINRWLGDLYQAPETYADINMEGVTNKQLGERIHSHTRKVMDQWALDTRPASKGGSSIHHADSTMQTLGAVRTAPTGMRRDIIQAVKDQDKELATGLGGKNFFDVSEKTHPLYHPGEGGKVDYKNRLAAIKEMPSTATFAERMAALKQSTDISTAASEAADASPQAQARQTDLLNRARSTGGGKVLDVMGSPFDRSNPLRTTENIGALRKYVGLSFKNGGVNFRAAGMGALGGFVTSEEAMTKLREGDYIGAAQSAGTEMAVGEVISQGVQKVLPKLGSIGRAVAPVARAIGPASLAAEPARIVSQSSPQRMLEARQRGGRTSVGFGSVRFTLPELGLSEYLGIN